MPSSRAKMVAKSRFAMAHLNSLDILSNSRSILHRIARGVSALLRQSKQRLPKRRFGNAALGDDRGDQLGGRDIESGVVNIDARRRGRAPGEIRHLIGGALLDGNLISARRGEIDR